MFEDIVIGLVGQEPGCGPQGCCRSWCQLEAAALIAVVRAAGTQGEELGELRPRRDWYAEFVDLDHGLGGFDELDASTFIDHAACVDEPLHGSYGVPADVVLFVLPDLRDAEVAVFGARPRVNFANDPRRRVSPS